jgi:3',5'-cyclic AMP phosphodiesterase CpdA
MVSSMERTVLLILSDIHFGRSAVAHEFATAGERPSHEISNAVSMKASLILRAKELHPTAILVTGDITSIASPAEFAGGVRIVAEIAEELGILPENRFFTFGNHDVNWRVSALAKADEKFGEDDGYAQVASRMPAIFVENRNCDVAGPVPGAGLFRRAQFDILVANSGFHCVHDQAYPHGQLGGPQLQWLRESAMSSRDRDKWFILMLHHHPFSYPYPTPGLDLSTLEEGAELLDLVGKAGLDLICHGHRHHPRIYTQMRHGWRAPATFFCAGSVAVAEYHRNNGEIPNLFHVITLETRSPEGAAVGTVTTFEYSSCQGWIPSRPSPSVPLDPSQRFGSCATAEMQRSSCASLFKNRLESSSIPFIELPAFAELPLCLQCISRADLKQLVVSCAADLDCDVVGDYPEPVLLKRKSS